ncbi:hypothetical protein Cgig2_015700 [Carnegiea gigantea]|uniref:Uncharacterized protein n=1 Tax=Carnegiea gigantea TaxID=171969 RepID=A0A9Q1K0H1_9CARY|nr:hypothetical protein Cgig2_015700 [Carnegiea gigantea]
MATRYAQDSNIPEMVKVIFYAMVVNEVAKRDITCRITTKCLMWALQQLHWGPFEFWFENSEHRLRGACALCPVNPPTDLASSSDLAEASGLSGAPLASSDEEEAVSSSPLISSKALLEYSSSSSNDLLESSSSVAPGKSVLKRKGRSLVRLVPKIVAEGPEFPTAPTRLDPQDGLGSHLPDRKVVLTLKRTALEKQCLMPVGPGFMTTIEKKSKVKHWKYASSLSIESQAIESVKGPERRKSKSSDSEPFNWLPKLKFFGNDFFLTAAGLLIVRNFSKGIGRPDVSQLVYLVLT